MKFIFTADWHIRPDTPRCRKDEDWLETQESQVDFVVSQVKKHDCSLIIGGDIFHKPQVPDFLKNMLMLSFVGQHVYAIAGNHDCPYHSWDNINDSSFGVLLRGGAVSEPEFAGFSHFGQKVGEIKEGIVFIHEPIFATAKDCPPSMKAKTADQVFDEYPDAKWILCGDIHSGYHIKKQGRHLIMAGCLNRQASNFKDYEPKIWLIDTDANTVEEILVPDDVSMITDEHIAEKSDREDRIAAFVTLIRDAKSVSLDFSNNVFQAISENGDLDPETINIIGELMNEI